MPQEDPTNSPPHTHTTLPRSGTRPTPQPRVASRQPATTGLLMKDGTLTPHSLEVREILMGSTNGDTDVEGLSPGQRNHILD